MQAAAPCSLADFDAGLERRHGVGALIGVDEAGRGPLAGPVVACACVVPAELRGMLAGVNDSKKLSAAKREKLFAAITSCGVLYCVAYSSCCDIDRENILQATLKAMRSAVLGLAAVSRPLVVVDGNHTIPGLDFEQSAVIGGDGKSLAVAAASIVAKVTRDRMMLELDKEYPGYGFARHKGYGTKAHYEALSRLGPCPQHRKTFLADETMQLFRR